ncbi:hypothetical protein MUN78_02900 [Leucobacter allii]|uniref:DUF4209 domain-containing protein n=1 Tax=Leucobacter allii TaxID=2932247 RepID=A0ABY4FNH9_9MICO|nr:hypothetical protein [Leucobacter allii]UOQ57801.1 hypothetical protein MUN78_02900 [Leucobacter allii]
MNEADVEERRVRFYGVRDLAAGVHAPRAAELAAGFDPEIGLTSVMDALELHNVQKYLEHGLLPNSCSEEEVDQLVGQIPHIRSAVARYFASIDNESIAALVAEVGYEFHSDLLDLLGGNKVFERCDSSTALTALKAARVRLSEMLVNRNLVSAYDTDLREELLAEPRNAEILARKYLEKDERAKVYLPRSFTSEDARNLMERYISDDEANSNYLRLISTAKDNLHAGIDAKLRLQAKRRNEDLTAKFFEQNVGYKTGSEVSISVDQDEPVLSEVDTSDGSVWRHTYSQRWLEETTDNPSILNNFQHLFEFADDQVLLTLPSYYAHLGVMERIMGVTGNTEYKTGVAFQAVDASSLLQTHMYRLFLKSHDISIEDVIAWFFEKYLVEEFEAVNFSFSPSVGDTSYLQRVRHLFAEMEGVANQFSVFVEDGYLDRDLLTMGADQVRYKDLPSLLQGRYVYPIEDQEIVGVLHALFSDQSPLNYIEEDLQGSTAVELLLRNEVSYTDFHNHQQASIDHLIRLGVLQDADERIQFRSLDQLIVLSALFNTQAANYYRLSPAARLEVDDMVEKGWLTRQSSLLTNAEADYFNYFLNRVEFSNGPNLRNRYLHGSQAHADGEEAHFNTYLVALRLLIALVIKMNDDFCLAAAENANRSETLQ